MKKGYKGYRKYNKLICNLSWRWSQKTNFSFDYLLGEANLVFAINRKKHNSSRNKFSTFIYTCITNHFKNLARNQNTKNKNISGILSIDSMDNNEVDKYIPIENETQETKITKQSVFSALSTETKEIVDIILGCPEELLSELALPIKFRKDKILKYCERKFGLKKTGKIEKELVSLVNNF